jgi:hypothetical protein
VIYQLRRLPQWRQLLDEVIELARREPHDWAKQQDCGMGLVVPAVLAMTGTDIAPDFRGAYSTEDGALGAIRGAGATDLAGLVAARLPEYSSGPANARVGDVAAVPAPAPFGWALGIFNGERVFVLKTTGLGTVDRSRVTRAFRV